MVQKLAQVFEVYQKKLSPDTDSLDYIEKYNKTLRWEHEN